MDGLVAHRGGVNLGSTPEFEFEASKYAIPQLITHGPNPNTNTATNIGHPVGPYIATRAKIYAENEKMEPEIQQRRNNC